MNKYLITFLLITITLQVTNFRLSTSQTVRLQIGDTLISTLGFFKATLLQTGCALSIERINSDYLTYSRIGNYSSPDVTSNCRSLEIRQGRIITGNAVTYMYVGQTYNISTIFTIDDWGEMRLIGTYLLENNRDQISQQFLQSRFKITPNFQTFFYPASQMRVSFADRFEPFVNNRNWQFIAQNGQLNIQSTNSPSLRIKYDYSLFYIQNSKITDINRQTFPKSILPNITFSPRCFQPRNYLQYRPPFVFVADPYWPIFTVYQQGRYKVFSMSISQVDDIESWQETQRFSYRLQADPCPPFTFQYRGSCVIQCPFPYYYQMRNQYGYCVLTCQQFTPQNQISRICSCHTQYQKTSLSSASIRQCPNMTTPYPYGCYCKIPNLFFDRKLLLTCVQICPEGTFASNGLCMQCPARCLTCQQDRLFRRYLECVTCQKGYSPRNGQCFKDCSPGMGLSQINGRCLQCTDPNCLNCTQSITICAKCSLLYSLQNGFCVQKCSSSSIAVPYDHLSFVCISKDSSCSSFISSSYKTIPSVRCTSCRDSFLFSLQDRCTSRCPQGYRQNSLSSCFCSGTANNTNNPLVTVGNQCLPIAFCPIQMGWHSSLSSCVTCNFGCISCFNGVCTECVPGYFLYVSPLAIRCRKKSPLNPCNGQYGLSQQICMVTNFRNPLFQMTLCIFNIPNCRICQRRNDNLCLVCNPGFYNFNNTCILSCPLGTIPYQNNVCILIQISNCQMPYLKINSQPFVLNYVRIRQSQSYNFYIFNGLQSANDPVGYIPAYQQLTANKNDGRFRNSQIYHPVWSCLKCKEGLGLSKDFKSCVPCPQRCVTCYMALNTSCLTIRQVSPPPTPQPPLPPPPLPQNLTCQYFTHQSTGKCVQSCSQQGYYPNIKNNTLYCSPSDRTSIKNYAKIDSSVYVASDGTKHVFFVVQETIKNSNGISVNIIKQSNSPRLSSGGRIAAITSESIPLRDGNYISYYDTNPHNKMYMMNLTGQLSKLVSSDGLAFSNSVYGVQENLSHYDFMKTWLAYIGYIMGITLILLHVVFIGNDLLYKADNAIILGQTIYFFSFVQLLVGRLLSQFYYGWIFTHFGFFPNFFIDTIPPHYVQLAAPNSFKLSTMDANVVRNAGFAMSLLLVFIVAYTFITLICFCISKLAQKRDMWHPKIAVNSLIGGVQFVSMSLFFWSVANLLYMKDADLLDRDFYQTSKSVSIFFIVIIMVYSLARWIFNPHGGLYMFKRIILATILAASYMNRDMMAPLLILETVFTVLRVVMESPQKKKQYIILALEWLIYMGTYLLLWLCLDAGVNTVIISIFMFIIIVFLAYDLTDIYLQSQNQWQLQQNQQNSSDSIEKAIEDRRIQQRFSRRNNFYNRNSRL